MAPYSTSLRVLVVMDRITAINPKRDSPFAMLLEAQRRGWHVSQAELQDIWLRDGEARRRTREVRVEDAPENWHVFGDPLESALGDFDVILMRKDPPFDVAYVFATYILERAEEAGALVFNRPQSLRDANEKVFISWFPECRASTSQIRRSHGAGDRPLLHGEAPVFG